MRINKKHIILCVSAIVPLVLILAFFIIPKIIGHADKKEQKAKFKLERIESLIADYYKEKENYPSSLNKLISYLKHSKPDRKDFFDQLFLDPWNKPYNYRYPGIHNKKSYDLWSYGADNLSGGEAENKDIANWDKT